MHINATIIAFELGDMMQGCSLKTPESEANLSHVMVFADTVPLDEHALIIATSNQFAQFAELRKSNAAMRSRHWAFLVRGEPRLPKVGLAKTDVIWVSEKTDMPSMINAAQKVFIRFNAWERSLGQIHAESGTAVDIIEASLPLFENDVCLIDDNHRIVVHRRFEQGLQEEGESAEAMPAEWIKGGMPQGDFDFEDTTPRFGESPLHGGMPYIVVPLVLESDYHANLFVESAHRPVCARDFLPALVLAHHVQQSFVMNAASSRLTGAGKEGYMMRRLVREQSVTEVDLHNELARIGWADAKRFCCAVLDYPDVNRGGKGFFSKPIEPVIVAFRTLPGTVAFRHNRRVVAIFDVGRHSDESYQEVLRRFADDYGMVAGYSDEFSNMMDLSGHCRQAEVALKYAFERGGRLLGFRACIIEYFAECALDTMPVRFLVSPGLHALFCDKTKAHLYEAVRTYLECGCSVPAAAERLFLRRNSMHYRLKQAQQLYGFDLDDPATVLELQLSLILLKAEQS